ncbi:MAG: flagellar biosynthetic protein FliO [Pseudomonadota bacterium]
MSAVFLLFAAQLATTPTVDIQGLFGAPAQPRYGVPAARAVTSDRGEASSAEPVSATTDEGDLPLLATMGTVLLVLASAWALWRRRRGSLGAHPLIRRIAVAGIAPGQGLAVVEVGDEILVVSTGNGGVRLIHRLEQLPASDDLLDELPARHAMSTEEKTLRSQIGDLLQTPRPPAFDLNRPPSSRT